MVTVTVRQIIDKVDRFEAKVARFYDNLSRESNVEAVRLLSDYVSRHRVRTKEAFSRLPEDEQKHIYSIIMKYEPLMPGEHCFDDVELSEDATVAEVLETVRRFDECIAQMYRQIVLKPVHHEVKDIFEKLIEWEENDEVELKKLEAAFC
ncbi:MAG TPA: hypothetical protein ENH94_00570 [Phycisphaerales bacterium]|nr:hypothetical protein [Phycisphaerales bacterium]